MRFLLDENIAPGLTGVLVALGFEAVHVGQTQFQGASDQDLLPFARQFDVFVTCDLHRQEAEWASVNLAVIEGGVKVLRIRLPNPSNNVLIDLNRSIVYRMDAWMHEFATGKVLVTVSSVGQIIRAQGIDQVIQMIEERQRSSERRNTARTDRGKSGA